MNEAKQIIAALRARTYEYDGCIPYGAAQIYALDSFVDDYFRGNVTEEIIRAGGTWDPEKHLLRIGFDVINFVEAKK